MNARIKKKHKRKEFEAILPIEKWYGYKRVRTLIIDGMTRSWHEYMRGSKRRNKHE